MNPAGRSPQAVATERDYPSGYAVARQSKNRAPAKLSLSDDSSCRTMPGMSHRAPRAFLVYWGPPLLWAALLIVVSGRAFASGAPVWLLGRDKLAHAAFYAMMAVLVFRALRYGHRWPPARAAGAAFLVTCLYGGMDEIAQRYQSMRNADAADFAADAVGASLVFLAPLLRLPPPREPAVSS